MSNGKDCKCAASSAADCGCPNADWTPQEVHDLRYQLQQVCRERDIEILRARKAERQLAAAREILKDALECDEYDDHTSGSWQIKAQKFLGLKVKPHFIVDGPDEGDACNV